MTPPDRYLSVIYAVLGGLVLLAVVGWRVFHDTSILATSNSPDGMYRCEVVQEKQLANYRAAVRLYHRETGNASSENQWETVTRQYLGGDPSEGLRANYSIHWEFNSIHRTTGVTVFGDRGTAPFDGAVVFEKSLMNNTSRPSGAADNGFFHATF